MNKILIITIKSRGLGGLDSVCREMVKALYAVGVETTVFEVAPSRSFLRFVHDTLTIRRIARSFDIIHALDGWPLGVYAWLAVLGTKKKLFINGLGSYTIAPLYQKFKRPLLKLSYERAQKIFCVSRYTEERILEQLPHLKNTVIIHMGTNFLPEINQDDIARIRSKLHLQDVRKVMITVGDIKFRKGQFDVLRAMNLLTPKYPDLHYLIVGTDEDRGYVDSIKEFSKKNFFLNRVHILPHVNNRNDLSALYSLADFYIMISNNYGINREYFEGFGLVFLEAASLGLPVLGSSGCGIEDALRDGYNGYLVKQGDAIDIACKIEKIYQGERSILSSHSKKFAQDFSWLKMALEFKKYYAGKSFE